MDGKIKERFLAIDTSRPMYDPASTPPDMSKIKGGILIFDLKDEVYDERNLKAAYAQTTNNNNWDPAAVSVMHNFGLVENYYRSTFNRNSIDDKGMNIIGMIHARFTDPNGNIYKDNAFWSFGMQLMVFGDGEDSFVNLPSSLDVAGHELTHGVINHSANLIYENQSGALNEHVADFFGAMVDRDDWQLGDGVVQGKSALRDMQNPHNPDILAQQPMKMSEFQYLANTPQQDNGGVHINSGIPNHMTYLLADGPQGIGRDKAEDIIYRALTQYLTQRSQFIDYRRSCFSAATDLFGADSAEVNTVKSAFDSVEITDSNGETTPSQPPTQGTPTSGDEQILFVVENYDSFQDIWYKQLVLNTAEGNFLVTERLVTSTRPAISGNGKWALFVDVGNNLYWTDGLEEQIWDDSGTVRTITMSKDQRYIAFTTTNYDNKIYIIDTVEEAVKEAQLTIPRSDGGSISLEFADILTYNFRGDYLVFDAVINMPLSNGDEYYVWGIYGMRMADGITQPIFTSTPGEQVANPTFSNTYDHLLLADFITIENDSNRLSLVMVDFLNSKLYTYYPNLAILAQPSFRGDDSKLLFTGYNSQSQTYDIVEQQFTSDYTNVEPDSISLVFSSNTPLVYPIGFIDGEYTAQEGQISAPESIVFGDVSVNESKTLELTISNQGNADLDILQLSIEGNNAVSFSHQGQNQTILAGEQITYPVLFQPKNEGENSAALVIHSTDKNQGTISVQLQGVGTQAQSTPTPVETDPTPVPTTPPGTEPAPIATYEFDQIDLTSNGWREIPGGFTGTTAGDVSSNTFLGSLIPESQDKVGISITVDPNEVAFIHATEPIQSNGNPLLFVLTARSSAPDAELALAAIKGNLVNAQGLDGSIATHIPAKASYIQDQAKQISLLYEPNGSEFMTPIIQLAANGESGAVTIYVDKLEVYSIESAKSYNGSLFNSDDTKVVTAGENAVYEFDQASLAANGWGEIPGGFGGAQAGEVQPNAFIGQLISDSQDQVGIGLAVDANELVLIHSAQPIDTGGNPVLIRLTGRASNSNASITVGALKGSMATAEGLDGSIATHFIASTAAMTDQPLDIVLIYEPDTNNNITPIVQVVATSDESSAVYIDKIEVTVLQNNATYTGLEFQSN
jgi:hypothetical protein